MSFNNTPESTEGDQWRPTDHLGELILCDYYEYLPEVTTTYGAMPAVRVLVTVIEGKDKETGQSTVGQTFDTMWFNKSLVRTGKKCLGKGQYLGRLAKQQFKNGPGIVLTSPSDEEVNKATRFESWMANGGNGNGQAKAEPQPVGAPSGGSTYGNSSPTPAPAPQADEPPF